MRIIDFLSEASIVADIEATSKEGVLQEMVELLFNNKVIADKELAVKVLLEREKLGSTGIGDGIAIPHGKVPELDKVVAIFGRSRAGIGFESMDGEPAHLFFLLMAPENSASMHLKALARISRLLKTSTFRQELLACSTKEELYSKISEEDAKHTP
jgi:PTS system nitrogen regulatory IIA component